MKIRSFQISPQYTSLHAHTTGQKSPATYPAVNGICIYHIGIQDLKVIANVGTLRRDVPFCFDLEDGISGSSHPKNPEHML